MPDDDPVVIRLVAFTDETLRPKDLDERIDPHTPLLELGILDSLKTAILLNFIRDELGVAVPPMEINARNFKDINSIAAMVNQLTSAPTT